MGHSRKRSILPPRRKFLLSGGGEMGGMDVFWNEPMCFCYTTCFNNSCTAFWWNKLGSFSLYYFNCSIQHALVVGGNNSMAYTDYGLIDMGYWHEEN